MSARPPFGRAFLDKYRVPIGLGAILLLTTVIYAPGMTGGFAFDDYPNIVLNQGLHVTTLDWKDWVAAVFSSNSSELQRPLAMLTFAAQHYFTGLDPAPMKAANLAIHLVNAMLVFGLVRSLCLCLPHPGGIESSPQTTALYATAFWAVAPINLMAVLFIVQRMESLSHTFVLAGLWLYVHGRFQQIRGFSGRGHILAGLVLGVTLGLLSKESAALLPLYAIILEALALRFRGAHSSRDKWLALLFIFLLLIPAVAAVIWLLPRAIGPGAFGSRDFTLFERLLTEPRVVLDYLRWSLLPSPEQMGLYHDDYPVSHSLVSPGTTWMAIIAIPTLLGISWWLRDRRPLASIGVFWFFAAHVLTASFLPLELVFEHRNYFASLGVALALTDLTVVATNGTSRSWIGALAALALITMHANGTWIRANEWRDPLTFARGEAARHPNSPRSTYQLGQIYMILGHGDQSSPFVDAAFSTLERARMVQRSGILPAQGLLLLSAQVNRAASDDWWREIERKLRSRPIGPQENGAMAAITDCVIAGTCSFPPENMYGMFNAALSHGTNPEVMNIVGNYLLNVENDSQTALRYWRKACELVPRNTQYRTNVAKLLIAMGRYDEARKEIEVLRERNTFWRNDAAVRSLEARMRAEQNRTLHPSAISPDA